MKDNPYKCIDCRHLVEDPEAWYCALKSDCDYQEAEE